MGDAHKFPAKIAEGIKTILIVEDDSAISDFLVEALKAETPIRAPQLQMVRKP